MIVGRALFALGLAVLVMPTLAGPAGAGGSGGADEGDDSSNFFGFVKDTDANAIPDARVSVTMTAGGAALITRTDATGAYKIPMFKDTDPAKATITCSKEGYRFKEVQRREATVAPGASAEIDCIIAHE
jgi:hypothetical protein